MPKLVKTLGLLQLVVILINLQGDNVDSALTFGAPALSLSRYISSGFSIGVRYGLGSAKPQENLDLDYSYLDGVLRYKLKRGKRNPFSIWRLWIKPLC